MSPHKALVWQPEWDSRLLEHVADTAKLSSRVIAEKLTAEFGYPFTRNAVIGRCHRLKTRTQGTRPRSQPNPNSRRSRRRQKLTLLMFAGVPARKRRPDSAKPLHIEFLDLKPHHCRWPYGDRPFTFCGCQKDEGSSYCAAHRAIGTVPSRYQAVAA